MLRRNTDSAARRQRHGACARLAPAITKLPNRP